MILITGTEGSSEHETAKSIGVALSRLWPGLEVSPESEELVRIAASAKLSGYKVADIDVLLVAKLRAGRAFVPKRVMRNRNGERIAGGVKVSNIVAAIEVKDHDPALTKIVGDSIEVRYGKGGSADWSNATDQNVQQMHAVKSYFEDCGASVYVNRLLIMRGFDTRPCSGALGRSFDGASFLTALAETSPVPDGGKGPVLRAGADTAVEAALACPVFQVITPSSLDRRRMDRIVTRNPDLQGYYNLMGTAMLRFRGRGGTGKTLMLLQMAWQAFQERGARSVILSYNHALTTDIRRLMALLSVPSEPGEGGVTVRTVMGFTVSWLRHFGLVPEGESNVTVSYEAACTSALEMIRQGAVTAADIEVIKHTEPELYEFDHVMADEAQDWPTAELELLKVLYPPECICLADGVDQLVRGAAANWDAGVPQQLRRVVPLKRCLRMKSNLASFANAVAEEAGVDWSVEPNPDAGGGRVIILQGPIEHRMPLVKHLLADAVASGNAGIDMLFCVPPSGVSRDNEGHSSSRLAKAMNAAGYTVWDGTSDQFRKDFPRSADTLRLVQYASCRGLEGWTVILDTLEQFWNVARSTASRDYRSKNELADPQHASAVHAWYQCLIPITRAIDTLVIGFSNFDGEVARAVLDAASKHPDIAEVYRS